MRSDGGDKMNMAGSRNNVCIWIAVLAILCCGSCGGSAKISSYTPVGEYRLTTTANSSGTIYPSLDKLIKSGGASPVLIATGNAGFAFDAWLIDGVQAASPQLSDGTTLTYHGNTLTLGNLAGSHGITARFKASIWISDNAGNDPTNYVSPLYSDSSLSYVALASELPGPQQQSVDILRSVPLTYPPVTPPIGFLRGLQQVWGVTASGWASFEASGQLNLIEPSGTTHLLYSSVPTNTQAAINDSGTILFAQNPASGTGQPPQYFIQSGWDDSSAKPISPDVNAYFMNNSGTIVGTSYGLNSIPKGTPVAYLNGQEIALSNVEGELAGLGNAGVLVTVPAPKTVNLYGNNGQTLIAQIPNLDIDTPTHGSGGIPNPFNRVVGCNAVGDIKVLGRSTTPNTNGDWGYWDSKSGTFVDVADLIPDIRSYPNPFLKLWSISDNDKICATQPYQQFVGYPQIILQIKNRAPSSTAHVTRVAGGSASQSQIK